MAQHGLNGAFLTFIKKETRTKVVVKGFRSFTIYGNYQNDRHAQITCPRIGGFFIMKILLSQELK